MQCSHNDGHTSTRIGASDLTKGRCDDYQSQSYGSLVDATGYPLLLAAFAQVLLWLRDFSPSDGWAAVSNTLVAR